MRKVLFFIICVFIQLNSGVIYGQYVNIDGDSRVCYDVNETYTHIPSADITSKVYFQRWTATKRTISISKKQQITCHSLLDRESQKSKRDFRLPAVGRQESEMTKGSAE